MRSLSVPPEPDRIIELSPSAPTATEPTLVVELSTNDTCAVESVDLATIAVLVVPA